MTVSDQAPIRVVFVDDETSILSGMQRSLRGMRHEWNMEFFSSGPAALDALAKAPADVIVSDMRMPGMDGWELLAEVRKKYPQTVRLLLSGYADSVSIMNSVGSAHQYLAKPCEAERIKDAIKQTQTLRVRLSDPELAALVGRVDMLPSAPQAFLEISKVLRRPDSSLQEAAEVVVRDAAMTANILKLVNSAFFGSRHPILRIDRAIAYLGIDTLQSLVIGHAMFKTGPAENASRVDLDALWRHSLLTASIAKAIAKEEGLAAVHCEEAFLIGMLHDVGKGVLATSEELPAPSAELDSQHARIGAYLLGLWGFPDAVVEGIANHHTPRVDGAAVDPTLIVHVADRFAHMPEARDIHSLGLHPTVLADAHLVAHIERWRELSDKAVQAEQAA